MKNRRTIVSIAFPSEDFKVIAQAAREQGKTVSAYIRDRAMPGNGWYIKWEDGMQVTRTS